MEYFIFHTRVLITAIIIIIIIHEYLYRIKALVLYASIYRLYLQVINCHQRMSC